MARRTAKTARQAIPPRTVERLDAGWRFWRGDAPGAEGPDYDDSGWRGVDLPHDWTVEDLPPEAQDGTPFVAIAAGQWRFQPGDDPTWKEPGLDDEAWQTVRLPATWEAHSNYTADNVYGWYRRHLEIPAAWRGREVLLLLGKIDDVDETFVNGVKVGGMGSFPPTFRTAWDKVRRYRVPAGLLKGGGLDVVAVRCFDAQYSGGLYAADAEPQRSGPFDSLAEGGGAQGFTVGGVGWYRRRFKLPAAGRGQRCGLSFDGVYMNATVWCNGVSLGDHPYGYTGFRFDLTPHLRFGASPNTVAVRVDASGRTSRWFSGAGISRHVWLTRTGPWRVAPLGVFVSTPVVTAAQATVRVRTDLEMDAEPGGTVTLVSEVVDGQGRVVAADRRACAAVVGAQTPAQDLTVAAPALWSPDTPALYRVVSTLRVAGRVADRVETPFGIRRVEIDAVAGFRLNGQPLKLRGGCVHHDNGCLGACAFERADARRVELLKASGYNAIRTSHNPPSPAFLDACDRVGMLVMDEAFDCWAQGKNPQDYGRFFEAWWQRDVEAMVRRDWNHPSVVLWSIGNEIPEQATAEGAERGRRLSAFVRALDPTRPVAIAAHPGTKPWEDLDAQFAHLDVCGYNYREDRYRPDHERLPARVIAGTESFPVKCFEHWMATLDLPYVIGDFVWTAMDYLGESALGFTYFEGEPSQYATWPWTVANCGDLDLCGWKRPPSYYRDAVWGLRPTVSCFVQAPLPPGKTKELVWGWGWPDERASWNWPGCEGQPLTLRVYSSCPAVRLSLNGRVIGEQKTGRETRFTAVFQVPYEPGELRAVGLDQAGHEAAVWTLRTAREPARIRLTPDRTAITADGQDLCFVTAEVLDADGVLHPRADHGLRFRLEGPGVLAAVGNGDPRSVESFQRPERRAYRGRCLAVLRAGSQPGTLTLRATADGLSSDAVTITVA